MKTTKPNCSICGGDNVVNKDVKNGRYYCKDCKRTFTHNEETTTETVTNQYSQDKVVLSAWNPKTGKVFSIDEYCEFHGLPRNDVKSYKLVSHTGTPYYNIAFHERFEEMDFLTHEFIESIVKKHSKIFKSPKIPTKSRSTNIIRGIYSDVHIGMNPDKKGVSIYGGVWNKQKQFTCFASFAFDIISRAKREKIDRLVVDELGDFPDGWDGFTVRRGHSLPQNMTNEEMFDTCVELKVYLADILVSENIFTEIIFNNICNDNHAGSFGYVVNSAVKSILEIKYPNIKVFNHRRFINHYSLGKHTFIISHGKDMEDSKFGFNAKLDPAGERKISNYIRENNLSGFIEFSKGDSHQCLFDLATSDEFDYMNYPSFAPSSQWVQTNFQKGRSGYVMQLFNQNEKEKIIIPKFFN